MVPAAPILTAESPAPASDSPTARLRGNPLRFVMGREFGRAGGTML
jgi:hypothetical protein